MINQNWYPIEVFNKQSIYQSVNFYQYKDINSLLQFICQSKSISFPVNKKSNVASAFPKCLYCKLIEMKNHRMSMPNLASKMIC